MFCDKEAEQASPLDALASATADGGVGLLIGPEGGFEDDERALILKTPRVLRLGLGPQILRADTAAVAALALIQAVLGDWRMAPAAVGRSRIARGAIASHVSCDSNGLRRHFESQSRQAARAAPFACTPLRLGAKA